MRIVPHCTCDDFPLPLAIVHTPIAPEMEHREASGTYHCAHQGIALHHGGSGILAREVSGGNEDHPKVKAPLFPRHGNTFQ
jgi:hypothetical protein